MGLELRAARFATCRFQRSRTASARSSVITPPSIVAPTRPKATRTSRPSASWISTTPSPPSLPTSISPSRRLPASTSAAFADMSKTPQSTTAYPSRICPTTGDAHAANSRRRSSTKLSQPLLLVTTKEAAEIVAERDRGCLVVRTAPMSVMECHYVAEISQISTNLSTSFLLSLWERPGVGPSFIQSLLTFTLRLPRLTIFTPLCILFIFLPSRE